MEKASLDLDLFQRVIPKAHKDNSRHVDLWFGMTRYLSKRHPKEPWIHERIYVCCQHAPIKCRTWSLCSRLWLSHWLWQWVYRGQDHRVLGLAPRRKSRWVDGEVSSPPILEGGRDEPLCAFSDCLRAFFLKWWCEGKLISIFILISADSVGDIFLCRIFVWFRLSLGWLKYTTENQFGAAFLSPFPASDRD